MSDIEWTVRRIGETGFAGGYDVYALMEDGRELAYGPLERMQLMASAPALRSQLAEAREALAALVACISETRGLPAHNALEKARALLAKLPEGR